MAILLAKVEKRVEASGRGRKAFLERRTLFALLGGQTALLLMFLCPSDCPKFCVPLKLLNKPLPVETSLDVYSGILEAFTGLGILNKKLVGSLEAGHTASS